MKFIANRVIGDVWFAVEFDADSWDEAEQIALEEDLELLGEKYEEHPCPADVEAMIEKRVKDVTEH